MSMKLIEIVIGPAGETLLQTQGFQGSEQTMGAREKLNAAHIQGAIILAVLIGGALESVGLAVIIGLIAIGMAYSKGNIR